MKTKVFINPNLILELKDLLKQSIILFLFGGVFMAILFGHWMGVNDFGSFVRVACFQGLTWVILWMGNGLLSNYLTTKFSWLEQPEIRFFSGVLAAIAYTIGSLTLLLIFWSTIVIGHSLEIALTFIQVDFFGSALIITAFISMFIHGRAFLIEWRASASEAERLRTENLSARYETLKNQVNPHFLFNSFNVLSTLVYKDQDKAAKFIKQLSNLYRYVLETKDKETVLLEDELKALESFAYLSKMRFSTNLNIQIDLEDIKQCQIAPMTLQMLVENAIKHNVVSKAKPLTIEVLHQKGWIMVRNNLQRKNSIRDSAGIGLPNIQARYEYLSDQAVQITENNDSFMVKIPVLEL